MTDFAPPEPIKVGDAIPSIEMHAGFLPLGGRAMNMATETETGKVIIMGLPGAFTPCWSGVQIPGYLAAQDALKKKGVEQVYVYCVNDGAVMEAWAKDQGIAGSMIQFLADPTSAFTSAIGMAMSHPGPAGLLGPGRCKRFVLVVEDGVVKAVTVSEGEDDPAGDNDAEGPVTALTLVDHVLTLC